MLESIKQGLLNNSNQLAKKEPAELQKNLENALLKKESQKSNSSMVNVQLNTPNSEQKEELFWGHFDLSLSKSVEGEHFAYAKSISMSLDIFTYSKEGFSDEKREGLSDIFEGEDYQEFSDAFFSLNGSETSIKAFGEEVDDLFSKISETLDIEEELFEGSKQLFKFSAIMYSGALEQASGAENDSLDALDKEKGAEADLFSDALLAKAQLYGALGDMNHMEKDLQAVESFQPKLEVQDFLTQIRERYSQPQDQKNDLFSSLNKLSQLSQRLQKYLG